METQTESVSRDTKANKMFGIYLSALGVAGVAIIILTVVYDWGLWGYVGGVILALAGFGGVASMLVTGGMGKLNCPVCGAELEVMHISIRRYMDCTHCGRWLEGAETMKPVPPDRVADEPVFHVPMPEGELRWPEGCPVCGEPATRTVELKQDLSSLNLAVVKVTKVRIVQAPCCEKHTDGVELNFILDKPKVFFRSYPYMEKFRELNG